MNKVAKLAVTVLFLGVLIGGFYFLSGYISSATGYVIKSDSPDLIASCIQEKGALLYTSPSCPECERQKQELSEVIDGFTVVDCSQSPRECLVLSKLPAMEYENDLYYGFMSLDETRETLDC